MPKSAQGIKVPLSCISVGTDIQLDAVTDWDLVASYKARPGLFVFPAFRERVLAPLSDLVTLGTVSLSSFDLCEHLSFGQVRTGLVDRDFFFGSSSDLCVRIAQLIALQPEGEAGNLLTSGELNLFYTPECEFYLYWRWSSKRWLLSVTRPDGVRGDIRGGLVGERTHPSRGRIFISSSK